MIQADSINTTSRRGFLARGAATVAGGVSLAIQPARASSDEPIFHLIEDHKAAIAAEGAAAHHYSDLEETVPEERRRGDTCAWEVTEVTTDDPRWTAACHALNDAATKADEIAVEMLNVPISSFEGLAAVMAYAGEHIADGYLWPDSLEADDVPGHAGCQCGWETILLVKATETVRQLNGL